jgi:hypothetical protein
MQDNNLNSAEVAVEQYVYDFIRACDTESLVAIYQFMECVKLEEVPTDTLHLKYRVTESESASLVGTELTSEEVFNAEKYLDMTIDDLQMIYNLVCDMRNEKPVHQL